MIILYYNNVSSSSTYDNFVDNNKSAIQSKNYYSKQNKNSNDVYVYLFFNLKFS